MFWHIVDHSAPPIFSSLKTVFSARGETITQAKTRDLLRVESNGNTYYVKRYWTAGKRLRAYCFRSRAKAEWENLQYFKQCGIHTPALVAYGEDRSFMRYQHGAFVMHALENVIPCDAALADPALSTEQRRAFLRDIAEGLRALHDRHFIHGDCFVRNFLVNTNKLKVYFTDCPRGRHLWGPFFNYGRIRDLASFYKHAMGLLSLPDQLRFFLWYTQEKTLNSKSKRLLKKITKRLQF
jgi:hypothetical protein